MLVMDPEYTTLGQRSQALLPVGERSHRSTLTPGRKADHHTRVNPYRTEGIVPDCS